MKKSENEKMVVNTLCLNDVLKMVETRSSAMACPVDLASAKLKLSTDEYKPLCDGVSISLEGFTKLIGDFPVSLQDDILPRFNRALADHHG